MSAAVVVLLVDLRCQTTLIRQLRILLDLPEHNGKSGELESNRELLMWITAGIVMSVVGLLISTVSLAERKWPQFKITPTDDSFRLACTLKVALVITKAMVVFLVAGLEQKTAEFKRWALVTISF